MFEISGTGFIKITRGDSAVINVDLRNQDNTEYVMQEGDIIRFVVKSALKNETPNMVVESTNNTITLGHNDTKNLKVGLGYYEVKLLTAAGDVYTLISVADPLVGNIQVYESIS